MYVYIYTHVVCTFTYITVENVLPAYNVKSYQCHTVLYHIISCHIISYYYYTILHDTSYIILLYCIVSNHILSYYVLLCFTMFYYLILCCVLLCNIILHYVLHNISYHTKVILYCVILCSFTGKPRGLPAPTSTTFTKITNTVFCGTKCTCLWSWLSSCNTPLR